MTTDAARNGTENYDEFPRDVHQDGEIKDEDFGATANIDHGRSASGRQVNPIVITVQKDQIVQFQLAENGKEHEAQILEQAWKASLKTKNWYNIKYIKPYDIKGTSMSINLSTVKNLKLKQKSCTCQQNLIFMKQKEMNWVNGKNWKFIWK